MEMDTRRLDALLAIHLFGLDAAERDVVCVRERGISNAWQNVIYDVATSWTRAAHRKRRMLVVPGGPSDYVEVDHYSTTWAGMGLVVEAMGGKGMMLQLNVERWGSGNAQFITPLADLLGCPGWSHADAAPLAVALAACRALGVEVPE